MVQLLSDLTSQLVVMRLLLKSFLFYKSTDVPPASSLQLTGEMFLVLAQLPSELPLHTLAVQVLFHPL